MWESGSPEVNDDIFAIGCQLDYRVYLYSSFIVNGV